MNGLRRRRRGVALIEALVALAVMAFGMLAMVGIQGVLRGNSDLAKQRSEAVRLAQEAVEEWRSFAKLEADGDNSFVDYTDIVGQVDADVTGINATYSRSRTVTALPYPQQGKTLQVNVSWTDRTGENLSVQLTSVLAGIAPELAASLVVSPDGSPVRQPFSRNRGIPVQARDLGDGTSGIKPPGAPSDLAWVFNNTTGVASSCTTTAASTAQLVAGAGGNISSCGGSYYVVGGFIRYWLSTVVAPSASVFDNPAPTPLPVTLLIRYTSPTPAGDTPNCFTSSTADYTTFLCAVPVTVVLGQPLPLWSGRIVFSAAAGGIYTSMAPSPAPTATNVGRACAFASNGYPVNAISYDRVSFPLANQNFLIVNGSFECPAGTTMN